MPLERYAESVQVREVFVRDSEIRQIVLEHVVRQIGRSYDFDYNRPIFVEAKNGLMLRFIQGAVTGLEDMRGISTTPFQTFVEKAAEKLIRDREEENREDGLPSHH